MRGGRSLLLGLSLLGPAGFVSPPESGGPPFWVVRRGTATVYLLGFGESRDTSWLTPAIRRAFDESSGLWLETAGPNAPTQPQNESDRKATAERIDKLARETGRTLFEALEPPVRQRTLAYLSELEIAPDSVKTFRPWRAYYVIVSAFYANRKMPYDAVPVDGTLERKARSSGKSIGYEFPNREAFVTFIASMSDRTQSQYMQWLLDFLDDYKAGLNTDEEAFGWIEGRNLPTRSLDRMRTRTPDLYQVMQPQRNLWWARKIVALLESGGTHFVAIGQLHVMGPDGIPAQLNRLGVPAGPAMQ